MFDVTRDIAENYFTSEEYEMFSEKNDTSKRIFKIRDELLKKLGNEAEDEITSSLFEAHNAGEYNGVIQGIGLGIKITCDCM